MDNKTAADWGRRGVESGQPDNSATADPQTALTDALANMMHFANQWGADFDLAILSASNHYHAELEPDDLSDDRYH